MASINIPKHVAIIPDGNRRWAKARGLPSFEGHRRGFSVLSKIAKKAREIGVKVFTVWAFSTENWNRSEKEVNYLMDMYEKWIDENLKTAIRDKIRIIHLGRKDRIRKSLLKKLSDTESKTKKFNKSYLCIALDYGGKDEILRAIKKIKNKNLEENEFNKYLDTKDLPYPKIDCVIRTSGEFRSSGFMLWQSAYSEYIVVKKHLPDFSVQDFEKCIGIYSKRIRRFGR